MTEAEAEAAADFVVKVSTGTGFIGITAAGTGFISWWIMCLTWLLFFLGTVVGCVVRIVLREAKEK